MKYSITGADKDTGEEIAMTIEAVDETAANEVAQRKGIVVSQVALLASQVSRFPTSTYPAPLRQPFEQGHYRGTPLVNIAPPRRGSSLGVASLILGIIAFLICWIPIVSLIGVPLSALGLVLGLIGLPVALSRRGASVGYPIAGIAVCGLALFIAISMTTLLVGGVIKSNQGNTTNNPVTIAPASNANSEKIRQLESEWNRLRAENKAMSASGINDARAFAENDKRIVEILAEINKLKNKN